MSPFTAFIVLFSLSMLYMIALSDLTADDLIKLDGSKQCDANGVCVAKAESKVSRFANQEGKAPEVDLAQCNDRHDKCDVFTKQGECTRNPGI